MNRKNLIQFTYVLFSVIVLVSLLFSNFLVYSISSVAAQEAFTATSTPTITTTPGPGAFIQDSNQPSRPIPSQFIIHFTDHATENEKQAFVHARGGSVVKRIDALDSIVIRLPSQAQGQSNPRSAIVESMEQDYYIDALDDIIPNDPRYPEQWAMPAIGAPSAWGEMPADAPKVPVAVIDSGICANHSDLAGRILDGWDFLENDSVPQDDFGHGCAVSGVIAANMNDGIGIAGVAPNAMIMPLRVLNASGVGSYSDVAAAIVYAADHGAQVINLSLGGSSPSTTLENAVNYAISKDVIVIAAAGNNGTEGALYPGAYPEVIAVGSVDSNLEHSSFSNYGPQIDIWAPGRDILTTKSDGSYGLVSGTSFAAPYVAGAEALGKTGAVRINLDGNILNISKIPLATTPALTTIETTITNPPETPTPTNGIFTSSPPFQWDTYVDPVFKYEIEYPNSWEIVPPIDQMGRIVSIFEPANDVIIRAGLHIYQKSQYTSLADWVSVNSQTSTQLISQTEIHIPQGQAVEQTFYERERYYKIVHIPFGSTVMFVELSSNSLEVDEANNDLFTHIVNSLKLSQSDTFKNKFSLVARLYPEAPVQQLNELNEVVTTFSLPLAGTARVTQTGDNGLSHNCSGTGYLGDCQALDLQQTPLGLGDGRVYASEGGTVIFNGYDSDYGYLVKIRHANGWVSWYGHLSQIVIPQIITVERGQWIGREGGTPYLSDGVTFKFPIHLHFMIKQGEQLSSTPINISYGLIMGLELKTCVGNDCGTAYGPPALYDAPGQTGYSQLFGSSNPSLADNLIRDNETASVRVSDRWLLHMYFDPNYGGTPVDYPGPRNANTPLGFSSLKLEYGCLALSLSCGGPSPTPVPTQPTPTLPPPSDGIQIVSVSSHVVRPGEQFNPSITIKHISGELVANRDHLHAIPEDNSNIFGAWPVQPLKSNVPIGGTYTFDINNDSSFRMTAPTTPGQYQSIWQMRVNGVHVGPQAVINITVQSDPISTPLPTPTIDCNNPPDGITLYEFTDFRGRCENFTEDVMYLGNEYLGDNIPSSIRVVGNWGVTLFRDPDWTGSWQEFSSDDNNLSDNQVGDNTVSSLRVWEPGDPCGTLPQGVTLYRGRDFTGISQSFSRDAQFLGNETIGDNTVNSIRVCGPYRVTLYRDPDWTGLSEDFTGSDSNLTDDPINDPNPTASSLRIVDVHDACNSLPSGVTLYSETDFNGRSQTFSSDVQYLGNGNPPFGNDAAKSLRVCGHWTVTVFRDADWDKNSTWANFTGETRDLGLTTIGYSASSLRMVDSYDFCRTLGPGVTLYRGRDFTGIAQTFTSDVSFLGNTNIGDNNVTSIRQCGYNSRLYRDPDWQGFSEEFTGREESNLTDNQINTTSSSLRVWTIPPTPTPTVTPTPTPIPAKPDLVPFDGGGWPFPLIPSSVPGDQWVGTLYAGQITYLDWAIFNNSNVNVTTPFKIKLLLDGTQIDEITFTSLDADGYYGIDDWNIYVNTPGYHILKMSVDSNNEIIESDENNNSWEGSFYWNQIPATCPTITAWKGEYWANQDLSGPSVLCRNDENINFTWLGDSPDPILPADHFSARWTRTIHFETGLYRFHVNHDDGARIYIDDTLLPGGDFWNTCCVWESVDKQLEAGDHTVRLEMFENDGWASAHLWWEQVYKLTVNKTGTGDGTITSTPAGINCGSACSYGFSPNTNVSLVAEAAPGSTFTGWSGGGCSGTGTCMVTMTTALSVNANFDLPSSPDVIFANSFEDDDCFTTQWTSCVDDAGDLSFNPPVLVETGNQSMVILVDDNNAAYVTSDHPNAETRYLASFYFDPNSIAMANGDTQVVFGGYNGASTLVLQVQFRRSSGLYQIQTSLLNDAATWTNSNWLTISDAPHQIKFYWWAANEAGANNGGLTLWIDGTRIAELTGVDNDIRRIDRARLGAVAGIDTGTRGTYYFDKFESSRGDINVYIGGIQQASYFIPPRRSVTPFYDGVAGGPVQVVSTNGENILASEHRNYQTSFSETLGYPYDQLTTKYWFTRYAYNANVKTWLLVANPSNSTANISVYIGNLTTPIESFNLGAGESVSKFYAGIAGGPVLVQSTNGVNILASEHRNYQTSFSETLGYPNDQLTTAYWFTRYAYNANVKTWLLVTNPSG